LAQKPKAGGAKKKASPKPRVSQKEQSERFVETAREIGVDESGKEFEGLLGKILPPKKKL